MALPRYRIDHREAARRAPINVTAMAMAVAVALALAMVH
jgi:hypothetical protein